VARQEGMVEWKAHEGPVGIEGAVEPPTHARVQQTAELLEQNLVSKKSTVGPSADPDTQSRYETARLELLAQLQAKANITGLTASR
jgi:hypothetical protein